MNVALAIAMLCQAQVDYSGSQACQQRLSACVLAKAKSENTVTAEYMDRYLLECVRERKNEQN